MKKVILFIFALLALGRTSCSVFNNEITQYVVAKEGGQLRPAAKVVYRVFVDRQEVVYWVEIPGQERSQVYKLRKCIVVDANNWEGDPDPYYFPLPWISRIEFVSGNFRSGHNAGWWTYYFGTLSTRSLPSLPMWGWWGVAALGVLAMLIAMIRNSDWWVERKKKGKEK